jgi:hypothetical protein
MAIAADVDKDTATGTAPEQSLASSPLGIDPAGQDNTTDIAIDPWECEPDQEISECSPAADVQSQPAIALLPPGKEPQITQKPQQRGKTKPPRKTSQKSSTKGKTQPSSSCPCTSQTRSDLSQDTSVSDRPWPVVFKAGAIVWDEVGDLQFLK